MDNNTTYWMSINKYKTARYLWHFPPPKIRPLSSDPVFTYRLSITDNKLCSRGCYRPPIMRVDCLHIWEALLKKNWPSILQTEYASVMFEKRPFDFAVACWICLHIFPFTIQDSLNWALLMQSLKIFTGEKAWVRTTKMFGSETDIIRNKLQTQSASYLSIDVSSKGHTQHKYFTNKITKLIQKIFIKILWSKVHRIVLSGKQRNGVLLCVPAIYRTSRQDYYQETSDRRLSS